jgi:tRNA(fMet)-specific endonuclease VapC
VYLLDTDTVSALMRAVVARTLTAKLSVLPNAVVSTSSITLGEIVYGAHRVPDRTAEIIRSLNAVLPRMGLLSFDAAAARRYGEIRVALERQGRIIGDADIRIASIALAQGLTVVTANVRHFRQVGGLAVENWLD